MLNPVYVAKWSHETCYEGTEVEGAMWKEDNYPVTLYILLQANFSPIVVNKGKKEVAGVGAEYHAWGLERLWAQEACGANKRLSWRKEDTT